MSINSIRFMFVPISCWFVQEVYSERAASALPERNDLNEPYSPEQKTGPRL